MMQFKPKRVCYQTEQQPLKDFCLYYHEFCLGATLLQRGGRSGLEADPIEIDPVPKNVE
jgi:hypothetical protein